ncbi:MAG: tetratricopeptide repeat protein, partial [Anaerolineae bacterium]
MSDTQVAPQSKTDSSNPGPAGGPLPLIQTKIRIPRRRRDLLPRARLVDFIHAHLDRKLILISAPAGYGKTSLLTDFAQDTDLPVCWYTLDTFDQDLHVFLEHFIAAIARRFPEFGQRSLAILRSTPNPGQNLYPLVGTLVQEIYDEIPEYFVLVLDDHHAVEEQEPINEFLDLFATYVDENCHLIIASRTLPALPNLSLLVARRQAAGLSIDELRFTPEEVQALALQNHDLSLTLEQAKLLTEHTGGWITGLMLTAVPRWETTSQEVAAHGRINVGLYDYLSKQVLAQQPAGLRDFLLASSVLEELGPKLCTEVLGVDQPEVLMDQIQVRNLFALEFEGTERRLRFHDLFRDFLRTSLQRRDENRYRELMLRAASAYAARHEWERAVSRYLELELWDPVIEIIEQTADQLFNAGRRDTLAGWIDALPEGTLTPRPQILLHRGKIYTERAEPAAALALYEQAEQAYRAAGDKVGLAHTLGIKSVLLRFQGRYAEALDCCDQAVELISGATSEEQLARALAYRNAGLCRIRTGKLASGMEALEQSLAIYEQVESLYSVSMVHHDLGLSSELAGDLDGAAEHYRAALQSWKQQGVPGPWANTLNGLGVVYYLQGKYDEAKAVLHEALTRSQQAGDLRVEAFAWASLGDLHRDQGVYEQAREAYSQALEIAERAHVGFIVTYALDALGNTFRLQGNLAQAYEHLHKALSHAQDHHSAYEIGLCQTSFGILVSEEGDLSAAQTHLQQAIEQLESGGYTRDLARAYLHLSHITFQAGDRAQALEHLQQTLALTDQLGSDQFLVVEGAQMQPLLQFAIEQAISTDLPRLLSQIEARKARQQARPEPVVETKPEPSLIIHGLGQPWVELDGERVQWTTTQSRDLFFCLL